MVYKITSQEELDKINKEYLKHFPDENIEWWSGCNYWKNQGNVSEEPVGTATSMHECDGCERLDKCKVKQKTPVWLFNDEVEKQMTKFWKDMFN